MSKRVDVTSGAGLATITLPDAATAAVNSNPISHTTGAHQGRARAFKVTASDCTNSVTYTFRILDLDEDVMYEKAGLTKDGSSIITIGDGIYVPLYYGEIVQLEPSGDPGSDWVFSNIYIYYDPDPYFRL